MPKLYLVCGIPVSGKTSVTNKIAATCKAVILSYSEIKRSVYESDINLKWSEEKEIYHIMNEQFDQALRAGENVVIDCVNAFPSHRRRYAKQAKKKGYHTICIFCHKHYKYALTANSLREDFQYSSHVIKGAFDKFIPPERHEGWDEIHVMDGNRYSLEVEGQIPVERRSGSKKRRI